MTARTLKVLIVDERPTAATAHEEMLRRVVQELERIDVRTEFAPNPDDAVLRVASDASLCAVIADAGGDSTDRDAHVDAGGIAEFLTGVRARNSDLPVFVMTGTRGADALDTSVLREVDQLIYLLDDTPAWIAGRIRNAAKRYRADVLPPMFSALVAFSRKHEYSWHTPGHEGGAAFLRSPAGRAFFEFYGEQTFRSDLSVSVHELGSLLDHSGPIGEAERRAATIFGADQTYFVTNGTSTSNRVVHQASVVAGDVMVLDRNAHKSVEQAATLTHGVPVYLTTTRNHLGIIGPVPPSELTREAVEAKRAASPLVEGDDGEAVIAMITNSTYDGLLYHVPTVERTLGSHVGRLHFDEAWYGYAAFHPIYAERFAMHTGDREADAPTTFATQSTHKLLAALSQASYLHVRQGRDPVDPDLFNEAFMMHASTSPLYSIIASNDVSAAMMSGRGGPLLTGISIAEAVAFRRTLARVAAETAADDWALLPWQPETVTQPDGTTVRFEDADEDWLCSSPDPWQLRAGEPWHGFELPDGYAMLDPIKVTVVTPGVRADGAIEEFGVPAPILAAYLEQQASIVVEKTQSYSILLLFSIGVTRGKWGSLVTTLMSFKRDLDANRPLDQALPATFAEDPRRYAGMGLRDLAEQQHEVIGRTGLLALQREAFAAYPQPAMTPAAAYARVVRRAVDVVALDDAAHRTLAVGVVPYPPGIPLAMPGETTGETDGPALGYLRAMEAFDARFPGFEHETHGVEVVDGRYRLRCVRED
ncbi:UNVERIFIED_CONTAM: arginine decarboxylase [Mumia flava]